MILDKRNEFADAVTAAASAGTAVFGNVIDLGATAQDVGVGEDIWLVIRTAADIKTAGTAGTIKFQLASDAQEAIATDGSATVHLDMPTFATGGTAAGKALAGETIMAARLPSGSYERYLGVLMTVGAAATTAGSVDAFLTKDFAARQNQSA